MNYNSLTNEIQPIQLLRQEIQVLEYQSFINHSKYVTKTQPVRLELYTVYWMFKTPPCLLVSIENRSKKEESAN